MMLKAIAIDDEPAALKVITAHADKIPFIHLKQHFLYPTEALSYLQSEQVDLIFLDVQMPDLKGTELAELLKGSGTQLVFVTAFPEYAVQGFQLRALDYLLKPVSFSRFLEACNRALQGVAKKQNEAPSFFIKDGYDWVRVELDKVQYIRSDTNLLFFHQEDRTLTTRMTVAKVLELLPAEDFIRVHKSYIVSIRAVRKIERHQLTVGKEKIPLAGSYKEEVQRRLLL
ncbi:MAG: LytTR family DNA-binding domain-containing protein [Bacteroidota bacterium]